MLNLLGKNIMSYSVSDFIISIKNAALARRKEVIFPRSKLNWQIAKILVENGFLESVKEATKDDKKALQVVIRYERRIPVINNFEIISKPSLRIYKAKKDLLSIERRGHKTLVVSTSKGLMIGKDAYKKGLGGEVLFAVW